MKTHKFLCYSLWLLALTGPLHAATPSSGTLDSENPITYVPGPFAASNPTPAPPADEGPRCNAALPCDSYKLTVNLPANSSQNRVKVTLSWPELSASDYDLYVYSGDVGNLDGSVVADVGESPTGNNPESVSFNVQPGVASVYTIKVIPYAVTPAEQDVLVTIELTGGGGGGGNGGTGQSCSIPAGVRP